MGRKGNVITTADCVSVGTVLFARLNEPRPYPCPLIFFLFPQTFPPPPFFTENCWWGAGDGGQKKEKCEKKNDPFPLKH